MPMSSIPNSVQGVGLPSSMVRLNCGTVMYIIHLNRCYG
jgi:hypothetical protein